MFRYASRSTMSFLFIKDEYTNDHYVSRQNGRTVMANTRSQRKKNCQEEERLCAVALDQVAALPRSQRYAKNSTLSPSAVANLQCTRMNGLLSIT